MINTAFLMIEKLLTKFLSNDLPGMMLFKGLRIKKTYSHRGLNLGLNDPLIMLAKQWQNFGLSPQKINRQFPFDFNLFLEDGRILSSIHHFNFPVFEILFPYDNIKPWAHDVFKGEE